MLASLIFIAIAVMLFMLSMALRDNSGQVERAIGEAALFGAAIFAAISGTALLVWMLDL